jgi:hypothetical protein
MYIRSTLRRSDGAGSDKQGVTPRSSAPPKGSRSPHSSSIQSAPAPTDQIASVTIVDPVLMTGISVYVVRTQAGIDSVVPTVSLDLDISSTGVHGRFILRYHSEIQMKV